MTEALKHVPHACFIGLIGLALGLCPSSREEVTAEGEAPFAYVMLLHLTVLTREPNMLPQFGQRADNKGAERSDTVFLSGQILLELRNVSSSIFA